MDIVYIAPVVAIAALAVAGLYVKILMGKSTGTKEMHDISKSIQEGAEAYLKKEYSWVAIFFVIVTAFLTVLTFLKDGNGNPMLHKWVPL